MIKKTVGFILVMLIQLSAGLLLLQGKLHMIPIVLHMLTCLILAWGYWRMLPIHYQKHFYATYTFLFILQFTMPVFGSIGMYIAVVRTLYRTIATTADKMEKIEKHPIPTLPYTPVHLSTSPMYSLAGLKSVLKHAKDTDKRLSAIIAASRMPDREAIPILQLALKDPEDDVRLLAYASLDKKENAINDQIHRLQLDLSDPANEKTAWSIEKQLAENFWELSYLGLAQGALRHYALHKAATYAEQSCQKYPQATTDAFLGKVYLALGNTQQAQTSFEKLLLSDLRQHQFYPYLAEIAFRHQRYRDCKQYMAQLPDRQLGFSLQQLKGYWHDTSI
jgi:tetratricopeptide (TPR) repeat protein